MDLLDNGLGYKRINRKYKEKLKEIRVKCKRSELETYLKESIDSPDLMSGVKYYVLSWWR